MVPFILAGFMESPVLVKVATRSKGAQPQNSLGAVQTPTGTGYGHTVKKNIGLAYLPLELAEEGTPLDIEIFGKLVPAQVAPRIMYDPEGKVLTS